MGSGVTASSNRGSDKGPVWTRIPRNGYFLLPRYSSRFPLAVCYGRASLLARTRLFGRFFRCSSASFPCDCDGYSLWLSETFFRDFFFILVWWKLREKARISLVWRGSCEEKLEEEDVGAAASLLSCSSSRRCWSSICDVKKANEEENVLYS